MQDLIVKVDNLHGQKIRVIGTKPVETPRYLVPIH
jgi:hypothetical protein